jgi:hypothetical protein
MKVQTCQFVSVTALLPKSWRKQRRSEFWSLISQDAPFSWGDNNRSMVTASFFASHCEERMDDSLASKRFLDKVRSLGEMYIDLES